MRFNSFCDYLNKLEKTSKRLEMTDILFHMIVETEVDDAEATTYLALGMLDAEYKTPKFNIADKMLLKVLLRFSEDAENLYKQFGDLGNVAEKVVVNAAPKNLKISEMHTLLTQVAQTSGTGSQDKKMDQVYQILSVCSPICAKYVTRIILGTTRLGFTDLTLIDALAKYCVTTMEDKGSQKEIESLIEYRYNIRPEIGIIVKKIKEKGIKGINDIKMEPGIPIKAQKPQRVENKEEALERIHPLLAEYKLDGTRVFLHLDKSKVDKQTQLTFFDNHKYLIKTFTRNLEETTHQFPDLLEAANTQVDADSVILDGEAIGYDPLTQKFLPFQETIQRKRKHGVEDKVKEIPLKYVVFDILYKNGTDLVSLSLTERRKILLETIKEGEVIVVNEAVEIEDIKQLNAYFKTAVEKKLEGLIVKSPNDPYQAGARSYSWIKLKYADEKLLNDSIDTVIIGYYLGKGARTEYGMGGFLAGVLDKNKNEILSITKVGTGLKEDDWKFLKSATDKIQIESPLPNIKIPKKFVPDIYVKPEIVVELGADEISKSKEHSAEYALRFPRLIKFRQDKSLKDITTIEEIKHMFKLAHKTND